MDALAARLFLHPLVGGGTADATCAAESILSTITTPNRPSAATIAITANVVLLFISKMLKVSYGLRISASKLQDKIICWNIANNSTRILKVLKEALRRLDKFVREMES